MPFKWPSFSGICLELSLPSKKKFLVKVGLPLTKLSGSVHDLRGYRILKMFGKQHTCIYKSKNIMINI